LLEWANRHFGTSADRRPRERSDPVSFAVSQCGKVASCHSEPLVEIGVRQRVMKNVQATNSLARSMHLNWRTGKFLSVRLAGESVRWYTLSRPFVASFPPTSAKSPALIAPEHEID
jgi:hypothetical protein